MNLTNKITGLDVSQNISKYKKVFFYRICGTGMGACASLLKEAGMHVEGGDVNFFPPMSTYLDEVGIPCHKMEKVTDQFLKQFDLIVVGNSVPKNSKYAEQIENCGVSFISFPELLGAVVLKNKDVIGIAGTHGKTTTTFFMTQLLEKLGHDCGYLIGGIINNRPASILGKDKYFVIESDEYDSAYFQKISKFRLYEIDHLVLTSLEFDHADIFQNVENIKDEFRAILKTGQLKSTTCDDSYQATRELIQEYKLKTRNYNLEAIEFISVDENGTNFNYVIDGKKENFQTNIIGKQNILNLLSCIQFLSGQNFKMDQIKNAIKNLEMVKRRQEVRGTYKGAVVIDDFAHHPRAVELTIDSIKQRYKNKNITVILEPVSATARSSIFQNEFAQSLMIANRVILANAGMTTTAFSGKNLDFDKIVSDLKSKNIPAQSCKDLSELRSAIDQNINENSVLLVLSNRTCLGLWESDFVKELH